MHNQQQQPMDVGAIKYEQEHQQSGFIPYNPNASSGHFATNALGLVVPSATTIVHFEQQQSGNNLQFGENTTTYFDDANAPQYHRGSAYGRI